MCAMSKVAAYFQAGVLPGDDEAFCTFESANLGITVNGTLSDTIKRYGLSDLVRLT